MNTLDEKTRFLWLDVETTGLDPQQDLLLEVAWWPTRSADPFDLEPADQCSYVLSHRPMALADKLSSVTWRMHGASGLLADVVDSKVQWAEVNRELSRLFERGGTWHLAGNSVHFDRRFLDENFHQFVQGLHHRILDVSSVKLLARAMGMPHDKGEPAHRALDDVKASIMELAACRSYFENRAAPLSKEAKEVQDRFNDSILFGI